MIKILSKIILIILILYVIINIYLKNKYNKIENFTPIISKFHKKKKVINQDNVSNLFENKNYALNPIDYNNVIRSNPLSVEGTRALNYEELKFKYGLNKKLSITYFQNISNEIIIDHINNIIFIDQILLNSYKLGSLEVLNFISEKIDFSNNNQELNDNRVIINEIKDIKYTDLILIYEDKYLIFSTKTNNNNIVKEINNLKRQLSWELNMSKRKNLISKLKEYQTKKLINLNTVNSTNIEYLFVCSLNYNYFSFIVKPILGIRNFKEIRSRFRFGILYKDDISRLKNVLRILHIINPTIFIYNSNEIYKDFINNKIDIIFLVCPHPNVDLINLSSKIDIMILNMDKNYLDQLIFFFGDCLFYTNFNASEYNIITPTGNINTFAIRNLLCAKRSVNNWSIFLFLKLLIHHLSYIKDINNNNFSEMVPSQMSFINRSLNYHPGAANFWDLNGNLIIAKHKNKNIDTNWYFWGESSIDSLNNKKTIFNMYKLNDLDSINRRSNTCYPDILIPRPNNLLSLNDYLNNEYN